MERNMRPHQRQSRKWCRLSLTILIIVWCLAVMATVTIPFFGWRLEPPSVIRSDSNERVINLEDVVLIVAPKRDDNSLLSTRPMWDNQQQSIGKVISNLTTTTTKTRADPQLGSVLDDNKQLQYASSPPPTRQSKPLIKSFLGIPLRFVPSSSSDSNNNNSNNNSKTFSTVHCVGDNFSPHAWKYRSCQFQHLCWRNHHKEQQQQQPLEFVLIPSFYQLDLERAISSSSSSWNNHTHHGRRISTQMNTSRRAMKNGSGAGVSLSGLTALTGRKGKFQWFPSIMLERLDNDLDFYQLENTVWIPFDLHYSGLTTSTAMLFDFIFPIYNLLAMFGWERTARRGRVLLTNLNRDCTRDTPCQEELLKYIPLLGPNAILHTLYDDEQNNDKGLNDEPSFGMGSTTSSFHGLICAPRGAAGLGYLTDHGWKRHGSKSSDYRDSRNVGRGILFDKFRQDALNHMGIRTSDKGSDPVFSSSSSNKAVWRIVVSIDAALKAYDETAEVNRIHDVPAILKSSLPDNNLTLSSNDEVEIHPTAIFNQSLYDQLQLISRTCLYICVNTGDSGVAAFLPRGASLLLFYDDDEWVISDVVGKAKRKAQKRRQAVMLDWDLWNNMAHLHVHWMPLSALKDVDGKNVLIALVHSELNRLRRQRRQQHVDNQSNERQQRDGTFNGLDVVHVPNKVPWSSVHCVGNNFQSDAASYRSCQYDRLCFDMDRKAFVTAPFPETDMAINVRENFYFSNRNEPVMIGHNARLANQNNVSWSPIEIANDPEVERRGYYELPQNVVWVPFFGETPNILNPGHLLWDFFLPIYTLATMFIPHATGDNSNGAYQLLLTNMEHNDCMPEQPDMCYSLILKFLPLMGATSSFTHERNFRMELEQAPLKSNLVCGKGVAGIGMLTDHALQRHGQGSVDYDYVVNSGRGPSLYDFRNFLLRNIHVKSHGWSQGPLQISVSVNSSQTPSRNRDFRQQIDRLQRDFSSGLALVKSFAVFEMPLNEQIRMATESAVYISVIGGATATATFLQRDASLILYVNDVDQFIDDDPSKGPVYMDWDFWNNASYLRVHWMTISTMDDPSDLDVLAKLVRNELFTMKKRRGF